MYVITHTPHGESQDYEQWLREVANPFFNSQPDILRYENWKVCEQLNGGWGWDYFDLAYVADRESSLAHVADRESSERVQNSEPVAEFVNGWRGRWLDKSDRPHPYHIVLCTEIAGPITPQRTSYCLFLPYSPREHARDEGYDEYLREIDNPFFNSDAVPEVVSDANWMAVEHVIGDEGWTDFDLMFVNGPDGWERFCANPDAAEFAAGWLKNWGSTPADASVHSLPPGTVGELIASP
jgi:hypothetical protein